jgi:hypothetical protein
MTCPALFMIETVISNGAFITASFGAVTLIAVIFCEVSGVVTIVTGGPTTVIRNGFTISAPLAIS